MLRLTRIKRQGEFRKYCFEEYSRPDYLARAVVILVDDRFLIKSLQINSALHGFLTCSHGRGLTETAAWENETEAQQYSGTSKYYSAPGLKKQAAKTPKVVDDVLSAAPSDSFRSLIEGFLREPGSDMLYPFNEYHLEPIRTTGQIHVLNYLKVPDEHSAEYIPIGPELLRIVRHINPVRVLRNLKKSFRRGIDGIQYVCESCGAHNPLLKKTCIECDAPRPKLKGYTVFIFSLRALIDMTYVLYVALVIGFLVMTVFGALRYVSRYAG